MKQNWIIFRDGQHKYQKYLKKGYGHVYILSRDAYNWVLIDPVYNNIHVEVLNYGANDPIHLLYARDPSTTAMYYIEIDDDIEQKDFKLNLFNPLSCVGCVKYYLGIKDFRVVTPYQLKKYLDALLNKQKDNKIICKIERN